MPSCKKNLLTEKRTVEITYQDGKKECKSKKDSLPKLRCFKAKRLIKSDLKENNQLVFTQDIAVGYYECNNIEDRILLKKLAVNGLIDLECEEIKLTDGTSTYWVTVNLTRKGKKLVVEPKKQFPEEILDLAKETAKLTPHLDQDAWGVPSISNDVDSCIINNIKIFYQEIANGNSIDHSLMSANMSCALELNLALKNFESNKALACPFYHESMITEDMVNNMTIQRLPRLVNAYQVNIGEEKILFALHVENNSIVIEDVLVGNYDGKNINPTFCSLCSKLTEKDMLDALHAKEKLDAQRAAEAERLAKIEEKIKKLYKEEKKDEAEEEHYSMCNICNPGIFELTHDEPTKYQVAKEKEHIQIVSLIAYKVGIDEILTIDVAKNEQKQIVASVTVNMKYKKVTAVGRIYFGMKEGEKYPATYNFIHYNVAKWKIQ